MTVNKYKVSALGDRPTFLPLPAECSIPKPVDQHPVLLQLPRLQHILRKKSCLVQNRIISRWMAVRNAEQESSNTLSSIPMV